VGKHPRVTVIEDRERTAGRGYYIGVCFKVCTTINDTRFEVGDGGLFDWTQKLVGSSKERLFISGVGLDRIAGALEHQATAG
jgi:hypothetical protein